MIELGNLIKSYREKNNITLDVVSSNTKIRKYVLQKIEEGEFSELPDIYAISFIKTYINYLSIPENEYEEFLSEFIKSQKKVEANYNPTKFDSSGKLEKNLNLFGFDLQMNWINYALYSAFVVVVLIILYFSIFDSNPEKIERIPESTSDDNQIILNEDDLSNLNIEKDSMLLEAFAIDSVWIRVDMDGNKLSEVLLMPNEKIEWKAKDYFLIHHGNVGALELKRDGKRLEPFGSPRSVARNVKVTREQVINDNKY